MITLYARKEITTDSILLRHSPQAAKNTFDTVLYNEPDCQTIKARIRWDKPQPHGKTIVLNCWNFAIEWIK